MDKDALYLEDVDVLTFKHGEYTRGVRYSAEPVIKVSGGNARRHYDEVKDVQCENKGIGMDGDVNWRCSTDLPVGLKMSDANVVCEGYGGPESDAVLRGSCMVDLQLNYEGDAYRSQHGGGWGYTRGEQESSSIGSFIMTVIVLLIVGWIVYKMLEGCCKPPPATAVPPSYNPDYEPPTAYPVGGGVGAAAGAYAAGPNVTHTHIHTGPSVGGWGSGGGGFWNGFMWGRSTARPSYHHYSTPGYSRWVLFFRA
uniref:Store-operated calcium entry-associated regulatory factor n=1 Tax=Palpitomonas bilix TaxID=652834 RepID=A0A7S3G6I1_9EUKA